jgi:Ni,Fe-hydrogenase I small subunit
MIIEFLDLTGLGALLAQIKQIFSTKAEVAAVEYDTDTYVLNVDYENTLAFDTKEIITSENVDIILEENEALMLTTSGEILVNINDEYIIIERGE